MHHIKAAAMPFPSPFSCLTDSPFFCLTDPRMSFFRRVSVCRRPSGPWTCGCLRARSIWPWYASRLQNSRRRKSWVMLCPCVWLRPAGGACDDRLCITYRSCPCAPMRADCASSCLLTFVRCCRPDQSEQDASLQLLLHESARRHAQGLCLEVNSVSLEANAPECAWERSWLLLSMCRRGCSGAAQSEGQRVDVCVCVCV